MYQYQDYVTIVTGISLLPAFLLPVSSRNNHLLNPTLLHPLLDLSDLFSTFPPVPLRFDKRLATCRLRPFRDKRNPLLGCPVVERFKRLERERLRKCRIEACWACFGGLVVRGLGEI